MRADYDAITHCQQRAAELRAVLAMIDSTPAEPGAVVGLFAMLDGRPVLVERVPPHVARERAQAELGAVLSTLAYHENV